MEMENWNIKALDDGYGDFKFDSTGKPDLIPAFSTTFRQKTDDNMLSKQEKGFKYVASEINGYKYVVGDYAMRLDPNLRWTGGENKHSDSRFPIILKTTLGLMCSGPREVVDILVMNLPIKYDTEERRKELTNIVKGNHELSISHDGINFSRKVITVEDVVIKKQPFGSLCDLMLNGMGEVEDYGIAKGFNVIVDIGARTLNILTINALDIVPELTTQTSDGMYTSYMQVGNYLESEFGGLIPDGKLPLIVKDKALRGKDLTPLIDRVYENQANTIINTLDKLFINSWNFVDNIIFTGGGAEILKGYFNGKFKGANTIFLDRYANVRGLRKYGLKLSKKRTKNTSTISAQIGSNKF
jgi:plasmid segregation protein ParM